MNKLPRETIEKVVNVPRKVNQIALHFSENQVLQALREKYPDDIPSDSEFADLKCWFVDNEDETGRCVVCWYEPISIPWVIMIKQHSITAYTNYPFIQPICVDREVKIVGYDGNKYCTILHNGSLYEVKAGYLFGDPDFTPESCFFSGRRKDLDIFTKD